MNPVAGAISLGSFQIGVACNAGHQYARHQRPAGYPTITKYIYILKKGILYIKETVLQDLQHDLILPNITDTEKYMAMQYL